MIRNERQFERTRAKVESLQRYIHECERELTGDARQVALVGTTDLLGELQGEMDA